MRKWIVISFIAIIILIGYLIPEDFQSPVLGADRSSYNQKSFWYYPWGASGTHKGIDIFARIGTPVVSSTKGLVVYKGTIERGGNVVLILGPKWRIHYYAHLHSMETEVLSLTGSGEKIGTVGATGNAVGKQPHLHYTIRTLLPRPWLCDRSVQGWKKMFYVDPVEEMNKVTK